MRASEAACSAAGSMDSPGCSSVWKSMSTMAEARNSTVAKPWLKLRAASSFSSSGFGHGLAGLVMAGETRQHLRLFQPMFVKLRRQFDKIARHIGARQAREAHLATTGHAGHGRIHETGCGRRRSDSSAGIGFDEIAIVDDQRQDVAVQRSPGRAGTGHPGAALLFRAARNNRHRKGRSALPSRATSQTRTSG